ncbi:hypothetical protein BGZ63DRAFT_382741 [Mariannaea sp. PMI_226]|nr:hypothetical protein BGZ63DRAFT_382741 [Mariannaea sp. PMI_226]
MEVIEATKKGCFALLIAFSEAIMGTEFGAIYAHYYHSFQSCLPLTPLFSIRPSTAGAYWVGRQATQGTLTGAL